MVGVDPEHKSVISYRRDREDAAVYREDDATFKNRLKENLVGHWLLNTVATLVIFVLVFRVLTGEYLTGLIAGLLVLMASNLTNVLWRIRDFQRWEIFSNGVRLGYDPRGELSFVRFSDIEHMGTSKGLRGNMFTMKVGGRKLKYPYKHNRDTFDLLRRKYEAFEEIQRSPERSP